MPRAPIPTFPRRGKEQEGAALRTTTQAKSASNARPSSAISYQFNCMTAPAEPRGKLAQYLDLIRFSRPAGWLVLLWPTLSALWLAAGGFPGWHLLIVFVAGTILMRSAG